MSDTERPPHIDVPAELSVEERTRRMKAMAERLSRAETLEQTIERQQSEIERLTAALKKVANPIKAMQDAVPAGYRANGAAMVALANDPQWYKDVAKAALEAK